MTTATETPAGAETPEETPGASESNRPAIVADVPVPPRSRTFTPDDVAQVLALLKGEAEGQDGTPAKNVGFGEFKSQGAARSAGNTLNRLLSESGAPHHYAVTTFPREGKIVGVLKNEPAKAAPAKKGEGKSKSKAEGK